MTFYSILMLNTINIGFMVKLIFLCTHKWLFSIIKKKKITETRRNATICFGFQFDSPLSVMSYHPYIHNKIDI